MSPSTADVAARSTTPSLRTPGWRSVVVLAALGGLYSIAHGQDINYDQFNNHVWAVWAMLHPHASLKAGVGGPSGFLPSVWNVPWYLAQQHLPAVVVGYLLGCVHGVAVWFAWALAWEVSAEQSRRARGVAAGLATLFAFFSPSVQTEFGTTFGNVTTAIPVLGALLLLVRTHRPLTAARAGVIGVLAGVAVGAKLSNAVFAGALLIAAVFALRRPIRAAAYAAAAGASVLGFLSTDGWWAYRLWTNLGNPFFPFLNQVFRSPYGPSSYVNDPRFSAGGPLGVLTLPFRTATLGGYPSEFDGRDVRWVVLLVLAAAFAATARRAGVVDDPRRAFRAVAAFVLVGYVGWAVMFDVGRYLAAVELASGALLLGLVEPLVRSQLRRSLALAGAVVVTSALLVAPDFGHVSWRSHWYPIAGDELGIPHGAIVVFPTNDSSSWVLAGMPGDVQPYQVPRVFSAQPWAPMPAPPRLDDEIARTLATTIRPVYAIAKASSGTIASGTAALYHRHVAADGCRQVRALTPLTVCRWDRD